MNNADARTPRELQEAANGLLAELQVWDHGFNYSPYHIRVQYGNHCYRHGMRIALMRDVLGLDDKDERVVSSAHAIIELARELDFEKGPTMNWYALLTRWLYADVQAPMASASGRIPHRKGHGDAYSPPCAP